MEMRNKMRKRNKGTRGYAGAISERQSASLYCFIRLPFTNDKAEVHVILDDLKLCCVWCLVAFSMAVLLGGAYIKDKFFLLHSGPPCSVAGGLWSAAHRLRCVTRALAVTSLMHKIFGPRPPPSPTLKRRPGIRI